MTVLNILTFASPTIELSFLIQALNKTTAKIKIISFEEIKKLRLFIKRNTVVIKRKDNGKHMNL